MPYYVKLKHEGTAFPLTCPYCNKRNANKFHSIMKKVYKPLFKKTESEEREEVEIKVPICEDCVSKSNILGFIAFISILLFFAVLIGSNFIEPLQNITIPEMFQYFGVSVLATLSFTWLRSLHLRRFKVKYATKEDYTIVTRKKEYAQSLALRNRTEAVKKLFIIKPLQ